MRVGHPQPDADIQPTKEEMIPVPQDIRDIKNTFDALRKLVTTDPALKGRLKFQFKEADIAGRMKLLISGTKNEGDGISYDLTKKWLINPRASADHKYSILRETVYPTGPVPVEVSLSAAAVMVECCKTVRELLPAYRRAHFTEVVSKKIGAWALPDDSALAPATAMPATPLPPSAAS